MRLGVIAENPTESEIISRGLSPTPLYEGYFGFMAARAIMAGWSLGIFAALDAQPADALTLAKRLSLGIDGTRALLNVLRAIGYLELDRKGIFGLSATARKWLVVESPSCLGRMVGGLGYYNWETWSSLEKGVRSGESVRDRHERSADDPFWDTYIRGIYEAAKLVAPVFADALDVRAPKTVLDVAGGHGALSGALCARFPDLTATVIDLEGSIRVGQKIAQENGYADRITWRSGDLFTIDFGSDYDIAVVSALINYLERTECLELLHKIHSSMHPGSTIAIFDTAFDEAAPPDEFDALTALDYVLVSGHRPYYVAEVIEFVERAGFTDVHRHLEIEGRMLVLGRA